MMRFIRPFGASLLSIVLACVAIAAEPATGQQTSRPNIVFILTDDLAPWALGVAGNRDAKTPNLDRLFRDGAYLVNAFTVTPVCSPSRAALMASRYGSELGITDFLNDGIERELGLDPSLPTWPKILAASGYTTGLVGKWHLGSLDKYHPTQLGYGYFMGFRGGGTSPKNPMLEVEGKRQEVKGFTSDILTDAAIEFIRRNPAGPFAISLHYRSPHEPWTPIADEDAAPFKDLDPAIPNPNYPNLDIPRVKDMTRRYLASVHEVDRNVGRLRQAIEELKLAEKTVIIFTSDHGYNMGHNGIWHKGNGHWIVTKPPPATENIPKNQRPNMYDNSLRVPTAVCWPGVIRPGTIVENVVANIDWFPTLVAIGGAEIPKDAKIRGRSFLPLLKGEKIAWDDTFYGEYSTHHQSHTHMRTARTPRWKLVRDFLNDGRDELYDLEKDPAETTNLIARSNSEIKQVVAELDAKILAHMKENGDAVLDELRKRDHGSPQ